MMIASDIETGKNIGMFGFDDYLTTLCKNGLISREQALLYALDSKGFSNKFQS